MLFQLDFRSLLIQKAVSGCECEYKRNELGQKEGFHNIRMYHLYNVSCWSWTVHIGLQARFMSKWWYSTNPTCARHEYRILTNEKTENFMQGHWICNTGIKLILYCMHSDYFLWKTYGTGTFSLNSLKHFL